MLKLVRNLFLFLLLFVPLVTDAKIIPTHQVSDILQEIDSNTFVFFDIDDTLLNTKILLGNSEWWKYFMNTVKDSNYNKEHRPEVLALIGKLLTGIPVVAIDICAPEIIKNLQNRGVTVLGLTARFLRAEYLSTMGDLSYNQLKSFGVDFSKTSLPGCINPEVNQFYSHGIIFTDHTPKGPYLARFLKLMDLHPKKIVFIDDSLSQIQSVEQTVESLGIEFSGLHYGKLAAFHATFNPLIANIQLEAYLKEGKILSDEEALKIAKNNPNLDPNYFLNSLIQEWKR